MALEPQYTAGGELVNLTLPVLLKKKRDAGKRHDETVANADAAFRKVIGLDGMALPVPVCTPSPYAKLIPKRNVKMGSALIKYVQKSNEEYEHTVEYDVDDEDEIFLQQLNKRREEKKRHSITKEKLELTFDRLEKETHFHSQRHPETTHAVDTQDDVCCICLDGEVSNVNQIIYCDLCNVAVHQECYGVPYIPEGQWLCRKCKLSPSEPVTCVLCTYRGGAFKPTSCGKWAHVVCAMWINEIEFGNVAFLEPIENVANSLRRRHKLRCSICKLKEGANLQCSKGSCVRSFHVVCAQLAGLQMVSSTEPDPKHEGEYLVKRSVFCVSHSQNGLTESQYQLNKKKALEAVIRSRATSEASDLHTAPSVCIPVITPEARRRISEQVKEDIDEMMMYWYYKRRKRSGVPLIRRLQAFTRHLHKKSSEMEVSSEMMAMQKGRAAGERVRQLCELMKKRERDKLEHMNMSYAIFKRLLRPIEHTFADVIKNVGALDEKKVFRAPVEIDGYSSVIKHPMDLSTMAAKCEEGDYSTLKQLRADFDLMYKNCSVFNKDNPYFLNYGRDMKKKTDAELTNLQLYLNEVEKEESLSDVLRVLFYSDGEREGREGREGVKEKRRKKEKKGERDKEIPSTSTATPAVVMEEEEKDVKEENRRKRKATTSNAEEKTSSTNTPLQHKRMKEECKATPNGVVNGSVSVAPPSTVRSGRSSRRNTLQKGGGMNGEEEEGEVRNGRPHSPSPSPPPHLSPHNTPTRLNARQSVYAERSFGNYRDNPLSSPPDISNGMMSSCDSSADSDVETCRAATTRLDARLLSDPNCFHYGDLVKVNSGSKKMVAALLLDRSSLSIDDPLLLKAFPHTAPSLNGDTCFVKLFTDNNISLVERSAVLPLDWSRDKCEGIEEARRFRQEHKHNSISAK